MSDTEYFEIGMAKRKITPQRPVPLAGFASRKGKNYEGIQEDIWVRILRIFQGKEQVVFVQGDLIWWDPKFVREIRACICQKMGFKPSHVIFTATHNHSGPATGESFVPELGMADLEYLIYLKSQVIAAIEESGNEKISVSCKIRTGFCDLNVYRRKLNGDGIQMMPNYEEKADSLITMITFEDQNRKCRAFGIHYSCHATLCGENLVFTDYPGLAVKMLEEENAGDFGFFWQGCAADLRPNSVLGSEFRRCTYEEAYRFTEQFVSSCQRILRKPGKEILPNLICSRKRVELPIDRPKQENLPEKRLEDRNPLIRHWAECAIKNRAEDLKTEFCRIQLGEGCVFYGISAEVAQEYGKYVRNLEEGAFCCGYTNGMSGYLCTAKQIAEGGYEPIEAALYFGVEGTFSKNIEPLLKDTLQMLALEKNRKDEKI